MKKDKITLLVMLSKKLSSFGCKNIKELHEKTVDMQKLSTSIPAISLNGTISTTKPDWKFVMYEHTENASDITDEGCVLFRAFDLPEGLCITVSKICLCLGARKIEAEILYSNFSPSYDAIILPTILMHADQYKNCKVFTAHETTLH